MKILLTGSNGLLGSSFCTFAEKNGYKITCLKRENLNINLGIERIINYLESFDAEVIIHCAANTNVEECERNPHSCYRDNTLLTEVLAIACRKLGMKMVFISSTGVYGAHKKDAYIEYDDVSPTTVHHHAKWEAEKAVSSQLLNYLIIRTGWLFGGSWEMKKNFVANRIHECLISNRDITSDNTQIGNPTYVCDVVAKVMHMIQLGITGTFNCTNEGVASRYEYVKEIVRCADLNTRVVASEKPFVRQAKVSFNESAINFKLTNLGLSPLPCWKKSLSDYINLLRGNW